MRALLSMLGFAFTMLGLMVAFLLEDAGADPAGGWMLVAAGLGLGVVSLLGAPRHTGTIGQRVGAGKSAP